MLLLIFSSLLGAMNFIATIVQLRAPGMTWFRLPFFVWSQFITAFLLLLAFPALQAAAVLQGMDRLAGTSFFLPSGLVVTGQPLEVAGGGNALLWQHLFWFLGHPEVYVLILPAMGIIAEVIANNTRKPLWGYRLMVYSIFVLGFLSFVVWAHHMFLTGMGTAISAFFQATTMIISIPSVIILSALILSLYGGSIRFNTPMLFALAFMPMFGLGGLTGLPLGLSATDIPLHDTNYVVAPLPLSRRAGDDLRVVRRHLLLVPEDHRPDDERDARPDSLRRLARLHERHLHADVHPGSGRREPAAVGRRRDLLHAQGTLSLNMPMVYAAFGLAFFQLFFIVNLVVSIRAGRVADTNPWEATTLEWAATSTPPRAHGNFDRPRARLPRSLRLQRAWRGCRLPAAERREIKMEIPYTTEVRPDTGLTNPKLGIWLFLASEVMLFGSLFSSYVLLRSGAPTWPVQHEVLSVPLAALNTVVLIASSVTMVMAWASLAPHTAAVRAGDADVTAAAWRATDCSWA